MIIMDSVRLCRRRSEREDTEEVEKMSAAIDAISDISRRLKRA